MLFTVSGFPAVPPEGLLKGLLQGDASAAHPMTDPGCENSWCAAFARSLENMAAGLDGRNSAETRGKTDDAGQLPGDGTTPLNGKTSVNAALPVPEDGASPLAALTAPWLVFTAAGPEIDLPAPLFPLSPDGPSVPGLVSREHPINSFLASQAGVPAHEILYNILKHHHAEPPADCPIAPGRAFPVNTAKSELSRALVEMPDQETARPAATHWLGENPGKTGDPARFMPAPAENPAGGQNFIKAASHPETIPQQAGEVGKVPDKAGPDKAGIATGGINPADARALRAINDDRTASVKAGDEMLRAFLNSLARTVDHGKERTAATLPPKTGGSGEPGNGSAHLSDKVAYMDATNGFVFPGNKGNPATPGELTGQIVAAEAGGERSNEKPFFQGLETTRSQAAFEKSLHQVMENRVVGQVFLRLFSGARQGSGNMTINIYPPELGSVKVRIVSDHGRLSVHLHPLSHQVAGILERNLGVLQQSLADQGLDVADVFVSVDPGSQESPGFKDHLFARDAGKAVRNTRHEDDAEQDPKPSRQDRWGVDGHVLSLRV